MKKHLRILYGCDDQYEITTRTTLVCDPYFDDIMVLNAGPKEFYDRLQKGVHGKTRVVQFEKFFEMETCRRAMVEDVPVGDWLLWLDADETPSPDLLSNLDNVIAEAEQRNVNTVKLIWAEHTEGKFIPVHMPLPKSHEEFLARDINYYFMPARLMKIEPETELLTHFGAHEIFKNVDERMMYAGYLMHHHKSFLQYRQSVAFSGFLNPYVHYDCSTLERMEACLVYPPYLALRQLQRETGVHTSVDLVRKLKIEKDENFRSKLMNLFMSFTEEDLASGMNHNEMNITFKFMKIFAREDKLNVESPYYFCGKECCKYPNAQL